VPSNRFPDVHIKLDTGLHRLGISLNEVSHLISELNASSHSIRVKSVYSHFIGSPNRELDAITQQQADLFVSNAQMIEKALGYSVIKHICDSGGIIHHSDFHLNMVRLGSGLYGIWSVDPKIEFLRVVVSLCAPIIRLESIYENETVGYIQRRLNRTSLIGVISIGYADGLRRCLNNGEGRVWICGHRVPIISITMDMTIIDLTDVNESVKVNDQVEIFGEHITVEEMAYWCKMSPFELLPGLGQRVKRVYIVENDVN
jgi:alanine racemase